MNVVEVVADGSPGGGTTHVLQLLAGLADGHAPSLITQDRSYLWREGTSLGVPVYGIDFNRTRLDVRIPLALRRLIGAVEPDLVHAHGGRAGFYLALARTAPPMVYTVHGYHFTEKPALARRLAIRAERMTARRATRIIFVSYHDVRVALQHRILADDSKATVVHNGVEISSPQTSSNGHRIGFVGRLVEQKDPLLFLDVVKALPEHEATVIGGGTLEGQVRARVRAAGLSDRVELLGAVDRERAREALSRVSVLVMTSRWEGFPIAAVEALALGVPVVAPKVGGVPELIEHERTGLLVDARLPQQFAAAVRRLQDDKALREHVTAEGRRRVEETCSEQEMLTRIRQVYEDVADRRA